MTAPEHPMWIGGRELRTASPIEVRPTCGQAPLAAAPAARVLVGPNEKVPSDRITPGRTPSLLQKEQ